MATLLVVCAYCQRLCDGGEPLCGVYLRDFPDDAEFSHGVCNHCKAEQEAEVAAFAVARRKAANV